MATHHTEHHRGQKWSAEVTGHSNAMDLEEGVFESGNPKAIAQGVRARGLTIASGELGDNMRINMRME